MGNQSPQNLSNKNQEKTWFSQKKTRKKLGFPEEKKTDP
jgi:hypothetical protein